jgi:hypothetical protein
VILGTLVGGATESILAPDGWLLEDVREGVCVPGSDVQELTATRAARETDNTVNTRKRRTIFTTCREGTGPPT